jgi:hypothetical protein
MIGKPYSAKLNVRFHEGELETLMTVIALTICVHQKVQKRLHGRQKVLYSNQVGP